MVRPADRGALADIARNVIAALNEKGLACLRRGSTVPHTLYPAFEAEQLRALLHQSARTFGKPTSLWTLDLASEVCCEQGISPTRITGETVRVTLARVGICWLRAKGWITSPDPQYARKQGARPLDTSGSQPSRLGLRLRGRHLVE